MTRRHAAIAAGRFLFDALSGRLGVPIMVAGYTLFALVLLGYVSTQVYSHSLMESIAQRKHTRLAIEERISVLTANYATMTSKSRVSRRCENDMGMVAANIDDVVRVAVDEGEFEGDAAPVRVQVNEVMGSEMSELTQVVDE